MNNLQTASGAKLILLDPADYLIQKTKKQKQTVFNESEVLFSPDETLDSFVLVDAEMLNKVVSQVNPTTCLIDSITSP